MSRLHEKWEELARAGLLGVGLPSRFGGQGGGPAEVWRTARRIGESSFDLGVGLSWVMHHIVSRFQLARFGSEEQKAAWLPRLASGESMGAMAAEEDDISKESWPMQATADEVGEAAFLLNGAKTRVVNAPVADLMVCFATTPTATDLEALSAFMVHRDTPGVAFEPASDRTYCPSSPQANVLLKDCSIPVASLLGEIGQGREILSLVGVQRDLLILQVICGYLGRLIEEVKPHLRRSDQDRLSLLLLRGRLQALRALNVEIAGKWGQEDEDLVQQSAAQAAARELIQLTRQDLTELPPHSAVVASQRDLELITLGWAMTKERFLRVSRDEEPVEDDEGA